MLGNRFADGVLDEDAEFEQCIMHHAQDDWYVPDNIVEYIQEYEYMNYLKAFAEEYNQE